MLALSNISLRRGRKVLFENASFQIHAGEIHYIRIDRMQGTFPARPKLLRVERATGVRELNRLSYSGHPLPDKAMQDCLQPDAS